MKHTQLIAAVTNVSGATFIGMDTLTEVTLTGGKKNPQQGQITKKMLGASVMAFTNQNTNGYDAMVRRRLTAEGKDPNNFKISERAWGVRVPNMPIVEHTKDGVTNYYLEVIFLRPGSVEYFLNGSHIDEADIVGLPKTPENKGQGGLDNSVILRCFSADSITELRIDGKVFN